MSVQPQLSPRKEAILRALVDEYIRTGEPVSSKLLADQLVGKQLRGYRLSGANIFIHERAQDRLLARTQLRLYAHLTRVQ